MENETNKPSPSLRNIQIFLLVLIVLGIGLLFTQKMWVPDFVQFLIRQGF